MIGKTLAHYEILEKIGAGGMGEVYRARDTTLDRDVALKVLPADRARDPERHKRFDREAKVVAALKHPNIVTLYSVEEADGVHFITMELVEGRSLEELIPDKGLSLSRFFELAIPLADAVGSAHGNGVTHRDLKPANIMLDGEGRLKVLDFGLAKLLEPEVGSDTATITVEGSATGEGRVLGTIAYMSPEQAEGKTVDHRSDIFSLGVMFYEMATGRRPFQGDSNISTLASILKETPPSVTEIRESLPNHLGRIIRRCLAKDPNRRFQSAADLRIELQELKSEIDSGEERPTVAVSAARPASSAGSLPVIRRERIAWLLVTVLVVAVGILGYQAYVGEAGAATKVRHIRIATADSRSGVYYPIGAGIARILERKIPNLEVEVLATDGSFENVALMDRGDAELAIAQNDVVFHAVKTDRVLGHRSTKIGGLAVLYEEVAHIMVGADSGIKRIEDLRGRAVNLNLPNSGSRFTSEIVLGHFGLKLTDLKSRFMSLSDANVALLDDTLEAGFIWTAAPYPGLTDVFRSGRVRLLSIAPELVRGLTANQPFLLPGVIPAGTYPNQPEEVPTAAVKAMLIASSSLDADLVRDILDAIFSNIPDLIASHPRAAEVSRDTAFRLKDGMAIDLHAGAVKFWR